MPRHATRCWTTATLLRARRAHHAPAAHRCAAHARCRSGTITYV